MSDYDEGAMDERLGWETAARELLDALPTVWQGSAEAVRLRSLLNGQPTEPTEADPLVFTYTNHRGETAERSIVPRRVVWGSTEWHPEPQWLLWAFDLDREAERAFPLRALVGGRPAAPTREEIHDAREEGYRAGWAAKALLSRSAAEPNDPGEIVERFRKALMVAHADDWDMDTVAEAAHVCAEEVTSWAAR